MKQNDYEQMVQRYLKEETKQDNRMKQQILKENAELKRTIEFNVKLNLMLIKRIEKLNKEIERLKKNASKL